MLCPYSTFIRSHSLCINYHFLQCTGKLPNMLLFSKRHTSMPKLFICRACWIFFSFAYFEIPLNFAYCNCSERGGWGGGGVQGAKRQKADFMLPEQLFASLSFFLPAVRGSRRFFSRCPACPMVIFNFPSLSFMSVAFVETFSLPSVPYCCFSLFFFFKQNTWFFPYYVILFSCKLRLQKWAKKKCSEVPIYILNLSFFVFTPQTFIATKLHKYHRHSWQPDRQNHLQYQNWPPYSKP